MTDKNRASDIASCLDIALDLQVMMKRQINKAAALSAHDYEGNSQMIENIQAMGDVLSMLIAQEKIKWDSYTQARKD